MLSIPSPSASDVAMKPHKLDAAAEKDRNNQEEDEGGPVSQRVTGPVAPGHAQKCIMCECGGMMMTIAAATQIVSLR